MHFAAGLRRAPSRFHPCRSRGGGGEDGTYLARSPPEERLFCRRPLCLSAFSASSPDPPTARKRRRRQRRLPPAPGWLPSAIRSCPALVAPRKLQCPHKRALTQDRQRRGREKASVLGNGRSRAERKVSSPLSLSLCLRCSVLPPSALCTAAFSARCSPSVLLAPSAAASESASERELGAGNFCQVLSPPLSPPLPRRKGVSPPPAPSHTQAHRLPGDGRSLSNPPGARGCGNVGGWGGAAARESLVEAERG